MQNGSNGKKNHWSQNLTHTQLELIALIFGFSLRNVLWRRTLAGRSVVGQHVTFGHWHATSRCSSLPEPAAPSCCRDINRWSWTLRDRFGCGFSCVCLYERHTTSHERHAKQSEIASRLIARRAACLACMLMGLCVLNLFWFEERSCAIAIF